MISKEMFKKANYFYTAGLCRKITDKENRIIYEVGSEEDGFHSVILEAKQYLRVNCDCTHSSLKSKYNALCSHSIAVLMEMMRRAK